MTGNAGCLLKYSWGLAINSQNLPLHRLAGGMGMGTVTLFEAWAPCFPRTMPLSDSKALVLSPSLLASTLARGYQV